MPGRFTVFYSEAAFELFDGAIFKSVAEKKKAKREPADSLEGIHRAHGFGLAVNLIPPWTKPGWSSGLFKSMFITTDLGG